MDAREKEMSRLSKSINGLIEAVRRPTGGTTDPIPKGWLTIPDIQKHYGFRWRHSASTRALAMFTRGLLDRKLVRQFSGVMCCRSYIYRILPPSKSLADADKLFLAAGTEKIPKGWATAKDIALALNVSTQAVWQMANRHKVPSRFYRVRRGLSGVCASRHFQIETMRRLHLKR
jgi:hypothetical protein